MVSFIIPVLNDASRLSRCLQSILANDYPREYVEIVVVDNGSTDESATVARAQGARVIRAPQARVGELRNLGAANARGDILAFVDADHELDAGWTGAAVDALSDAGAGGAGDQFHAPPDGTWVQKAYDGLRPHQEGRGEAEWLGSGNLAIWRHVFDAIGGFDATLTACEDVDLCRRLRAAGWRLIREPRLRTVHAGDPKDLAKLFQSELWRGRDNLKVSLRRGLSWRVSLSAAISLLELICFATILAGLISLHVTGLLASSLAAALVLALTLARSARIVINTRRRGLHDVTRAFAVAFVYDTARALALILRRPHRRTTLARVLGEHV